MDESELKTPLRAPKRYKKGKSNGQDLKMMEFMSYHSSDYFSEYHPDDGDDAVSLVDQKSKDSLQTEKRIEDWLTKKNIQRSVASEKKEVFFEEKRDRINSISYFDHLGESDSTDLSKHNPAISPVSLQLSPGNSKICQKRSNFSSLANIEIESPSKRQSKPRGFDTFQAFSPDSKGLYLKVAEEDESPSYAQLRQSLPTNTTNY